MVNLLKIKIGFCKYNLGLVNLLRLVNLLKLVFANTYNHLKACDKIIHVVCREPNLVKINKIIYFGPKNHSISLSKGNLSQVF